MEDTYLARWLNKELSEEELASFRNTPEYASYEKIRQASSEIQAPDYDVEKAFEAFSRSHLKQEPKVIRLRPFRRLIKVAAVIIVIFSVTSYYFYSLKETVSTEYAQTREIRLPDNSQVLLNADSEISYDEKKWDRKRNIKLRGEAFFKVANGKKFTVNTGKGVVTVLGTQFNVENREGFFEVTCFEGLVNVSYNSMNRKLPAGSSFVIIDGAIQDAKAPDTRVPSWVNRESSFTSIPLAYVFDEFERQFDIHVETRNIDLGRLFTGTFSNTNMNLALQSISTPSKIYYNLEEGKVLFYGENAP